MSDKVKMSVTCVKCGKHTVDWRDTLEQKHWTQLDERPLCPKCAGENAEIDMYCADVELMAKRLRDMRYTLSAMLTHRLAGKPLEYDNIDESAAEAFTAVSKAYRAVQNLAGDFHFKQQQNIGLPKF